MRKILIIKTGRTFKSILQNHGDFENFIINKTCQSSDFIVWSVCEYESPPNLDDVSGIIITGSHSMVSEFEDWSLILSDWLRSNLHKSIPTLGICYGHQLICQSFGGHVSYHPKGKEIGTVKISLTDIGKKDPLLGILPSSFFGHVTHAQSALQLPLGARVLAYNDFEQHHAFVLHDTLWGVQFHPEFN